MKRNILIAVLAVCTLALAGCGNSVRTTAAGGSFPKINQKGKVGIAAHRGFWNCPEGGYTQNSIAALKAAQDARFWGSEMDIHITSDDVVVVNHDNSIGGVKIQENPYSALKDIRLKNGEPVPTFDAYLTQGEKSKKTMLVVELKIQKNKAREDVLVEKTVELLKAHDMFSPDRVAFISFSYHMCEIIAARYPQFINQYLNGDKSPEALSAVGINGIDYENTVISRHSEWPAKCAELGMSSNVWTVNKEAQMKKFISNGVNTITTNDPLLLRQILGKNEFKK